MFFARGGQQGVNDLNNSDDKMSVLKRYLGSAIAGAIFGNGNDLISRILGSFGGKGSSAASGGSTNHNTNTDASNSGTENRAPTYSGGSPPITNSKTGVSIVDSRPGERRPSSTSDFGSGSRRGSSSSGRSDSEADYSSSSRTGNAGSRRGSVINPTSGNTKSSKTGVSIVDSRPDDRRRVSPTTGSPNRDPNDYESDLTVSSAAGSNEREAENRGSQSGLGRYSGNRRGETEEVPGQRRSAGNRGSSAPETDY